MVHFELLLVMSLARSVSYPLMLKKFAHANFSYLVDRLRQLNAAGCPWRPMQIASLSSLFLALWDPRLFFSVLSSERRIYLRFFGITNHLRAPTN